MADITMCTDSKCPKRNTCYRFKAKPSQFRQSYFMDSYFMDSPKKEDGSCDHYWETEKK